MFEIGTIVEKKNYTQAAVACNIAGDRHIEKQDGQYIIVANPAPVEPTVVEKVAKMEAQTGLTRPVREMVLSENSGASDYAKAKAQEIEDLAAELRTPGEETEPEAPVEVKGAEQ